MGCAPLVRLLQSARGRVLLLSLAWCTCETGSSLPPHGASGGYGLRSDRLGGNSFLLQRVQIRPPAAQPAAVRGGGACAPVSFVAMFSPCGLRPLATRAGNPVRMKSGVECLESLVVFAGHGSPTLKEAKGRWSSPLSVGVHGDYEECRRKYARYVLRNPELAASLDELSGCQLVCGFPIGFEGHADVLSVAAEGYRLGERDSAMVRFSASSSARKQTPPPQCGSPATGGLCSSSP